MITILSLVLHLVFFSHPISAVGNPKCSPFHDEVNRHTIYSVINSLPHITLTPIPGQLQDSSEFNLVIPGGGPWYFPALFQTPNGDSQVAVSVLYSTLAMNMHDEEEVSARVWAHARNMALQLYTQCQTATTGRGGRFLATVGEAWQRPGDYHTIVEVKVGTNLGITAKGTLQKPVSVYNVPRGGGLPILHRTSRLIDQPHPEHQ